MLCSKQKSLAIRSKDLICVDSELITQHINVSIVAIFPIFFQSQISNRLIDLKELSDEHVELQCSMIHWLHCIHEIFEQNASQFETYKNQFEEHLASVTRKLNIDIEALLPKLAIIDDMYDTAKLHCYKATLDGYMEEIKCFEDYAKWINKEEKLFKLPVLQYPIIDSLKDFVNPFYKLIG